MCPWIPGQISQTVQAPGSLYEQKAVTFPNIAMVFLE